MSNCDFSEKTYETAYNTELTRGPGFSQTIFAPSQRLENLLGFDSAANPGKNHVIWKVLGLPRPQSVTLQPTHWPQTKKRSIRATQLTANPVSLILQYKIPEHLAGTTKSTQHALWNGAPYYRFKTDPGQHKLLETLEEHTNLNALVRYASPHFHTMSDFDTYQLSNTIVGNSQHVAPSAFNRSPSPPHRVWTYEVNGSQGRPNPDGEVHDMETFEELLVKVSDMREGSSNEEVIHSENQALNNHIEALAGVCTEVFPEIGDPIEQWSEGLETITDLSAIQKRFLRDYATIQSTLAKKNAHWWLM